MSPSGFPFILQDFKALHAAPEPHVHHGLALQRNVQPVNLSGSWVSACIVACFAGCMAPPRLTTPALATRKPAACCGTAIVLQSRAARAHEGQHAAPVVTPMCSSGGYEFTEDLLDSIIQLYSHPDGRDLVQQQLRGVGGWPQDMSKGLLSPGKPTNAHPDGGDLVQQQLRGGGGGHAVQRHVHQRGDAARRRRPRGCGRAWMQDSSIVMW